MTDRLIFTVNYSVKALAARRKQDLFQICEIIHRRLYALIDIKEAVSSAECSACDTACLALKDVERADDYKLLISRHFG